MNNEQTRPGVFRSAETLYATETEILDLRFKRLNAKRSLIGRNVKNRN